MVLAGLAGCGGSENTIGAVVAAPRAKWTLLVYMNAANDLDAYSSVNIGQMEQAATNPDVRIVVQWKQATSVSQFATFNGTRRYLIQYSPNGAAKNRLLANLGTGVDMGIPQTLHDFVAWGKAQFPADHTLLVIWDHGNGWLPNAKRAAAAPAKFVPDAFSYDSQTGHAIEVWQINQAFQGVNLDIVAFDASLMQMDEVAYQLMGYTGLVAGSEESPPGSGYPYQTIFAQFANTPDESPQALSQAFVTGMLSVAAYASDPIEQSVVNPAEMPAVATAAGALAQALVANGTALAPIIPGIRSSTQSYLLSNDRYFFDSIDLCDNLSAATNIASVQSACANYVAAAGNAIVWEGHNSNSSGSHGLSIDFSPSSYYTTVSSDYQLLAWNTTTGWGNWLAISP